MRPHKKLYLCVQQYSVVVYGVLLYFVCFFEGLCPKMFDAHTH